MMEGYFFGGSTALREGELVRIQSRAEGAGHLSLGQPFLIGRSWQQFLSVFSVLTFHFPRWQPTRPLNCTSQGSPRAAIRKPSEKKKRTTKTNTKMTHQNSSERFGMHAVHSNQKPIRVYRAVSRYNLPICAVIRAGHGQFHQLLSTYMYFMVTLPGHAIMAN